MRVTALHRFVRPLGPLLTVLALAASVALVSGCPRQADAPDPLSGTPCTQLSECNTRTCGALRLCVDGFCEAGTSLLQPCRGEGEPVRPPSP